MDLEDFCASLLVHLRLVLELFFILKQRLDSIIPGVVGLSTVKMGLGKFVVILNFLLLLNFILVELFAFVVFLSFHQDIAMVLDLVHFFYTEAVVGQNALFSIS